MSDPNEWQLVFRGAESRLWFGSYNGINVVKKERFVKKYRILDLDLRLTRERIRAEVRAIRKIKDKSPQLGRSLPSILLVDNRNIIMTQIKDSINVCQHLSNNSVLNNSNQNEMINELLVSLGQIIAQIHSSGVIHGDLTTSNFLIKRNDTKQLIPIDFGLSSFSTSSEDRAVDLYVLERALISTHPNLNFEILLQSYAKHMDKSGTDILKKLEAVRLRGRKRIMIG
jgi:TP53 regulating kinase-like protein